MRCKGLFTVIIRELRHLDFYKLLGYPIWTTLISSAILVLSSFASPFEGLLVSLCILIVLWFLRWFIGYKRYSFERMRWELEEHVDAKRSATTPA